MSKTDLSYTHTPLPQLFRCAGLRGVTQILHRAGPTACAVQNLLLLEAHHTDVKELCSAFSLQLWKTWRNLQVDFVETTV